jgi:hypothetical protein
MKATEHLLDPGSVLFAWQPLFQKLGLLSVHYRANRRMIPIPLKGVAG